MMMELVIDSGFLGLESHPNITHVCIIIDLQSSPPLLLPPSYIVSYREARLRQSSTCIDVHRIGVADNYVGDCERAFVTERKVIGDQKVAQK